MKRIGIWLLALLLTLAMTACEAAKTPVQEPETVTEQPKVEETKTQEVQPDPTALAAGQVADTWREIGQMPEDQTENGVPVGKIGRKLLAVSICPCMAQEHAQWDLARWGYGGYDGEPVNGVLLAFRTYLTEHYAELTQTYGELIDGTVWILDSDGTNAYLQIIAIDADSAQQLVLLRQDGDTVDVSEGTKSLVGNVAALCAGEESNPEAYQAALDDIYLIFTDTADVLFTRVCRLRSGFYMKNCFMRREGDTADEVRVQTMDAYIYGQAEYVVPLHSIPQENAPELLPEWDMVMKKVDLTQFRAEDYGVGYIEALFRRYLLSRFDENERLGKTVEFYWDDPITACDVYEAFGTAQYGFRNLLKEMALNPELKQCLESMPSWKFTDFTMYFSTFAGITEENKQVTVKMSLSFVLVDGFETSYQEKLRTLADEAKNSELISEEIKQEFLDYLVDYVYGYEGWSKNLAGLHGGTTVWVWSLQSDGTILLKAVFTPDGVTETGGPSVMRFKRSADGVIGRM